MPAIPSPATWRTHPQIARGLLWVHVPEEVISRRVNQASFTYPITSLTFDNPDADAGSTADVEAGMTLRVTTSAGVLKGYARVRTITGTDTGTLGIGAVGQGDLDFADNDILVVLDEYRIWNLSPSISSAGVLFKDYDVAYSDQTEEPPPVANVLIECDDWMVDPSTSKITVEFDGTSSLVVAPGAAEHGTTPYVWDVGDGTITVGTVNTSTITATFPAGVRYVTLTFQDDNDKTHTQRVLIPALTEASTGLYPVLVSRLGDTLELGWEASFSLLADDVSDFEEGARVLYFEQEWYDGTAGPLDGLCTKFDGWIVQETQSLTPLASDDVVINCKGPMGILMERPAFPQTVSEDDTPDNWAEMKTLDVVRLLHYLLQWHSTILDLYPLTWQPSLGYWTRPRMDTDVDTLKAQIDFWANAIAAKFTCDKHGHLYLRLWPVLQASGFRDTVAVTETLTEVDWDEDGLQIEVRDADDVAWVRGSALVASPTLSTPYRSAAPGAVAGQGAIVEGLERQIVSGQTELNNRTGWWYAWRNSRQDGRRVIRRVTVPLLHRGLLFDTAWCEWTKLTFTAASNKRGLARTAARFVLMGVESTYDHERMVSKETLTLVEETDGAAGITVEVPTDGIEDAPIPSYPPIVIEDPVPDGATPTDLDLVYAATQSVIKRTWEFTAGTPVWETVYTPPAGYDIRDFRLDQHDPKNKAVVVLVYGSGSWADKKVVGLTNLNDASPTATDLYTGSWCAGAHQLLLTHTIQYPDMWFIGIVDYGRFQVLHTHDYWQTVTKVQPNTADLNSVATAFSISYNPTAEDAGGVWCGDAPGKLRVGADYGGTFPTSITITGSGYQPHWMMVPWWDNASDLNIWTAGGSGASHDGWMRYSDDGGGSWANRSPSYGGYTWGGGYRHQDIRRPLLSFVTDPSRLVVAAYQSQDKRGTTDPRCFVSEDTGQTWTHRKQFASKVFELGGWPYDQDVIISTAEDNIEYSDDFGVTWSYKSWVGYSDGLCTIPVWLA